MKFDADIEDTIRHRK